MNQEKMVSVSIRLVTNAVVTFPAVPLPLSRSWAEQIKSNRGIIECSTNGNREGFSVIPVPAIAMMEVIDKDSRKIVT